MDLPERRNDLAADDKAARMLEMYAAERFLDPRSVYRVHLMVVIWAIRSKLSAAMKRLLDVAVAAVALLLASPIILITALAIKIDSPGPVFFQQTRVGKNGRHFACFKFRSMYANAEAMKALLAAQNEADGPVFKMKRDPRVTRVGAVIRKFSIDELPQLLNVLKGEMSLVGPRPALPKEVAQYQFEQLGRLHALPGLTGLQQVSGRSDLSFDRWTQLDLQYVSEQSLWQDLKILIKTIPAVISGRGAY
jgi:exopolysaccharide biosynthesis polyprenyl glycosylphosphotransferase